MGVSENSVPLSPMVLLIIPIKWRFVWECTIFSDKPLYNPIIFLIIPWQNPIIYIYMIPWFFGLGLVYPPPIIIPLYDPIKPWLNLIFPGDFSGWGWLKPPTIAGGTRDDPSLSLDPELSERELPRFESLRINRCGFWLPSGYVKIAIENDHL